nr:LOW QUALITY PROTEIN: regulator of G-protein signaling protein-like [Zonotrichia albicollis]
MNPASIASTDMGLLLQDDVFVDFFNIFLSLPIFGQTPLYISGMGRWCLWPEPPSHLSPWAAQDASPAALLAWLEKQRLPHFCKSSLCLHLVLCQRLLAFIRSGEAGEELMDFWLITERLLGLDESDGSQRELFLSLEHRLRATHLREGSSVLTFCTTIVGKRHGSWDEHHPSREGIFPGCSQGDGMPSSPWGTACMEPSPCCNSLHPSQGLFQKKHIQSISTRREILSKMREQVLFMIQSYWLPKFLEHCKMGMEEEELCRPLLQEYQKRLSQAGWQPPGLADPVPTMHIKRSQGVPGPYCSQKAKAEVWAMVKEGRDSQELKMATFQVKAEKQPGPAGSREELWLDKNAVGSTPQQSQHPAFGGRGRAAFPGRPQSSAKQDLQNLCKVKMLPDLLPSASLARLPSLKKPIKTLDFLPWALSAEACAGRPFRDFLQHQNRPMEALLLDLWHDLEEFLPVVLDSGRENSFSLRHLIGEKICKTYLEDSSIEKLPLETRTLVSLWNRLTYGEFSPWIFRAQKEICKVLCGLYEEFLAADDRTFLQFMHKSSNLRHSGPSDGDGQGALCRHPALFSPQAPGMDVPMAKVPGRAAGRWGHFHLSQRMNQALQLSQALHGTRSLEEVSSKHWQLLAARDLQKGGSIQAEMELLLGSHESQRMIADELAVSSPSREEELLQLTKAALGWRRRTEKEKKQKQRRKDQQQEQQQDLLPWNKKPRSRRPRFVQDGTGDLKTPRMAWAWAAIRELVRSFCKFRRDMKNQTRCAEFQDFLRQERRNKRESMSGVPPPLLLPPLGLGREEIGENLFLTFHHRHLVPCYAVASLSSNVVYASLHPCLKKKAKNNPNQETVNGAKVRQEEGRRSPGQREGVAHRGRKGPRKLHAAKGSPDRVKEQTQCWAAAHSIFSPDSDLPVKEKKSKGPAKSPAKSPRKGKGKGKGQQQQVTLIKRRILDKQIIIVNFLVDDLRFYLEMDRFSKLADGMEDADPQNTESGNYSSFLKKKLEIISKLFLNSDIPPKLRVNISQKERDFIWRSSSKGPLTRAIYHNAKVTLFPILMFFWRRFCTWKVMRTFQAYQGLSRFGTPEEEEEEENSELPDEGDRSSQEPKGGRSSKAQQQERSSKAQQQERSSKAQQQDRSSKAQQQDRSSQEPKGGRSSKVQQEKSSQEPKGGRSSKVQQEKSSQEPKGGRSSRGRKEGKVPASAPAKSPSKAAKSPGPKKLEVIASTTQHAPGKKALLSYNMSDGLGLLLPRPPKKTEPPEEQKAADASGEKRPSLTEPALQAGP